MHEKFLKNPNLDQPFPKNPPHNRRHCLNFGHPARILIEVGTLPPPIHSLIDFPPKVYESLNSRPNLSCYSFPKGY